VESQFIINNRHAQKIFLQKIMSLRTKIVVAVEHCSDSSSSNIVVTAATVLVIVVVVAVAVVTTTANTAAATTTTTTIMITILHLHNSHDEIQH
jgi:hypothetical protein